MSAITLLTEAASTAAELAALLFVVTVSPASAAGASAASPAPSSVVARPSDVARDLHFVDAALEMRLLGMLADVRIMQTVRNDSAQPVDLGSRLPAVGDATDQLTIARDGRCADLLGAATVHGGDDDPHAGRASAAEDEAIADLLQLPPGHWARVATVATEALQPSGGAYRVTLPATMAPLGAQALRVDEPRASALVVVPPTHADGRARLTLRYADGPARQVLLGHAAKSSAWVVPLDADRLAQLVEGAVELEIRDAHTVHWLTLPVRSGTGSTFALRAD
jgi:hypothetical protein